MHLNTQYDVHDRTLWRILISVIVALVGSRICSSRKVFFSIVLFKILLPIDEILGSTMHWQRWRAVYTICITQIRIWTISNNSLMIFIRYLQRWLEITRLFPNWSGSSYMKDHSKARYITPIRLLEGHVFIIGLKIRTMFMRTRSETTRARAQTLVRQLFNK